MVATARLRRWCAEEDWKHAETPPLLKKPSSDPSELKNFRPISLLPYPTTVLEKAINAQLRNFTEVNNSLDSSQSGFRSNHSTERALLAATNHIRLLLDRGHTAAIILLDLSAAFNTVSHSTLHTGLHDIGICQRALKLIHSFLSRRTQRVRLPPYTSRPTGVNCGGSSLSPTLFNIYMAPLAAIVRSYGMNIMSYTDDTQLIISLNEDPDMAKRNFHSRMEAVTIWMRESCLKHNSNKTELIIFGNATSAWDDSWGPTSLSSPPALTEHARNLGIILDSSLSMTCQVNSVTSSVESQQTVAGQPPTP
ncbi:hypothetical protein NDU88_003948 [Pleurodeles waltl]|uniref:Reverse transcriptase domain-containing protein n=1 Tax=Pleurodeles waltl TaxID=8319 RepID=A0AAV7L393_PLEWA|nr:hypothetical protein NDU88_003948 [Pleurodeles waltl]